MPNQNELDNLKPTPCTVVFTPKVDEVQPLKDEIILLKEKLKAIEEKLKPKNEV